MTQSMLSKSNLWCQELFQGRHLSEIAKLFLGNCRRSVTATISTKTLVSHGEITGNVTATEQVTLKNTSLHNGDVSTPNIIIENGAVFNGSCAMRAKDITVK